MLNKKMFVLTRTFLNFNISLGILNQRTSVGIRTIITVNLDFEYFKKKFEAVFHKFDGVTDGKVADYIPELAKVSPQKWGASLCTIQGDIHSIGDCDESFTLQSCCKPLVYAYCLKFLGKALVHSFIGQEPSGRTFNEIFLDHNQKPHNPMINSGAITACALANSLIAKDVPEQQKFDNLSSFIASIAGEKQMGLDENVYRSEKETGHNNYALLHYLKAYNCFPPEVELDKSIDLYFKTCSITCNTKQLAVIAATLANGGKCPTTNVEVLSINNVRRVLTLMYSCGMYDYSGNFAFEVGLPAKSGVSGALMLVVPYAMGIGLWSPALGIQGNSVRGVLFCSELSERFNFHRFDYNKFIFGKQEQETI